MDYNKDYPAEVHKLKTGACGNLYLIMGFDLDKSKPILVLTSLGKGGGCASAHLSALAHKITSIMEEDDFSKRMKAYSKLTGFSCIHAPSCIELLVRRVINTELRLKEEQNE